MKQQIAVVIMMKMTYCLGEEGGGDSNLLTVITFDELIENWLLSFSA
jgi:hypothetical protein